MARATIILNYREFTIITPTKRKSQTKDFTYFLTGTMISLGFYIVGTYSIFPTVVKYIATNLKTNYDINIKD